MDPTVVTELTDALSHLQTANDAAEAVGGNTQPIQQAAFILRSYMRIGGGQWTADAAISVGAHSA